MYPTRTPYEESSIFSQVNLFNPDLEQHSDFADAEAVCFDLLPGDVLYVPKHWWHFVQALPDQQDDVCISLNLWCESNDDLDRLKESIVSFLANGLLQTFNFDEQRDSCTVDKYEKALNLEAPSNEVEIVTFVANKVKNNALESNDTTNPLLQFEGFQAGQTLTFNEMSNLFNWNLNNKSNEKRSNLTKIYDAIFDPEVIDLIAKIYLKRN